MSLSAKLRELVRQDRPQPGRVVSVFGNRVRVSTAVGQVEVAREGDLQVGDAVTVQDGQAVKKRLDGDAPVFFV